MVLHGDELGPAVHLGGQLQLCELPGEHGRGAEIKNLARLHHVMERLHRLFDRRSLVTGDPLRVAVNDQLVDVVHAKTLKAGLDAFNHMLA